MLKGGRTCAEKPDKDVWSGRAARYGSHQDQNVGMSSSLAEIRYLVDHGQSSLPGFIYPSTDAPCFSDPRPPRPISCRLPCPPRRLDDVRGTQEVPPRTGVAHLRVRLLSVPDSTGCMLSSVFDLAVGRPSSLTVSRGRACSVRAYS